MAENTEYKCPLVRMVCPEEYMELDGSCTAEDKKIPICIATANNTERNDGTGFRVDQMVELGWKYCISDNYKECPYYKLYHIYAR